MLNSYMVISSTASIRQAIINGSILCDHGSVSMLRQGIVTYIYLCELDKIEINPEVESRGEHGYRSVRNTTPIGIIINETGKYTSPSLVETMSKYIARFLVSKQLFLKLLNKV
ncbi:MAG: hypothetical protein J7K21_03500 [Desulfurococcales archaeon]|nr:hypothetical protein [Desulfurococcales archaeon]